MVCDSPGSARAISGKGTGLTLGSESMPSAGANHGWKVGCAVAASQVRGRGLQVSACGRGGSCFYVQREPKWGDRAVVDCGMREVQGG